MWYGMALRAFPTPWSANRELQDSKTCDACNVAALVDANKHLGLDLAICLRSFMASASRREDGCGVLRAAPTSGVVQDCQT